MMAQQAVSNQQMGSKMARMMVAPNQQFVKESSVQLKTAVKGLKDNYVAIE